MKTRMKSIITLLLFGAGAAHAQDVSQTPLTVGAGVPGNMLLTPSVEFPTINSKANLNAFAAATEYTGYFDPRKCYLYSYNATESLRHFYPSRSTGLTLAVCSAASLEWSGNWLNWATTQTIDPFRKALTGGLRVRDTATETWLEKARHDGQGGIGYFPNATTTGTATISGALPNSDWSTITTRVVGGGSEMYFTSTRVCSAVDVIGGALPVNSATQQVVEYDPATHVLNSVNSNSPVVNTDCDARTTVVDNRPQTNANRIYRVSIRVKVCDNAVGLEANCVQYTSGYKPEGLIQKYSRKIRFSVFGYLLDNGAFRDGGVLRANQKYVGPTFLNKDTRAWETNEFREWDDDGVFIDNPNPIDASATEALVGAPATHPIRYSGVVNYINRFAQLTGTNAKNFDPVSELYYTATRYLRNLAPVSTYSDLTLRYSTATGVATTAGADRFNLTDGFPVITRWEDPYEYHCQKSAILGIGDVYTHKDKNLKGDTQSSTATNEPARPAAVTADPMLDDAPTWTRRAYTVEGIAYNGTLNAGLHNSPYMVGLAYYAHTQDLRTEAEMPGLQRISTHWVDVRETQKIEPRVRNQYWMAAKYGGFTVPGEDTPADASDDYNSVTNTAALNNAWWSTAGDNITSNSTDWPNETFRRAANYYVADRPATMVDSLTRAFANIASEGGGSGSALAANSTRLDTATRTYQAQFKAGSWQGQVTAHDFNLVDGAIDPVPIWRAGEKMPVWSTRNIRVNAGGATAVAFNYTNLNAAQKTAMSALAATLGTTASGTNVVDFIRGDRSKEESQSGGVLRTRPTFPGWSPILGDIVNSTPIYVGAPNRALWAKNPGTWTGKDTYDAFAVAQAARRPVVWVGANDGMVHAFDATEGNAASGSELYAFVPMTAVLNGLVNVADPDYQHRYFVDGDMAIADIYTGGAWKTVLVGTMGRGAPGVFALDVTNPLAPTFMWEHNHSDIPELGHNIGRPIIAQVMDGNWRVIFGNGSGSTDGTAKLISINLSDGAWAVISTDATPNNDLSAVTVFDSDLDGLFETVYAGDLNGNLWKITDLTITSVATKMFTATDGTNPQPITAMPTVGKDPATGTTWVWFGTGRFLEETDLTNTQVQSWYGIKDEGVMPVARSELVERTMIRELIDDRRDICPPGWTRPIEECPIVELRRMEEGVSGDMDGKRGWFIDLTTAENAEPGERMVEPNLISGQTLVGVTRTPVSDDACNPGFASWFLAINPFTGARLDGNFWNINHDARVDGGDNTATNLVQSGVRSPIGANRLTAVGNLLCTTLDDGSTTCMRVAGSNADARRGSWREITN